MATFIEPIVFSRGRKLFVATGLDTGVTRPKIRVVEGSRVWPITLSSSTNFPFLLKKKKKNSHTQSIIRIARAFIFFLSFFFLLFLSLFLLSIIQIPSVRAPSISRVTWIQLRKSLGKIIFFPWSKFLLGILATVYQICRISSRKILLRCYFSRAYLVSS